MVEQCIEVSGFMKASTLSRCRSNRQRQVSLELLHTEKNTTEDANSMGNKT